LLQDNENEEDQTSLALRAKVSAYFVLNTRSGLLKGESGPGVSALGEEWGFLEIELSDMGPVDPVPCAYLVMASLSRRAARVPFLQSRHLLDVPVTDGTTYQVWLGQVLSKAREAMQVLLVLDAATTVRRRKSREEGVIPEISPPPLPIYLLSLQALDLPRITEGCMQRLLDSERVVLEVGKTQARKSLGEGRLTSLSVVRSSEHEWTWNAVLPALELPGLPPRREDTTFIRQDGTLRLVQRCGGVGGVLKVTFAGVWDPLVHALKLAEVVATVARLSWMAASFSSDARPGFVLAGRESNGPLPVHELPFRHTSGLAGALCHTAFERPSEYTQGSLDQAGRFFLSFADPHLNQVRGAWGLVEDDFCRSLNFGQLLERIEVWANPLQTLAKALQDHFPHHHFDMVPWSLASLAVTCTGAPTEGLLLLTVASPGSEHGQSGVVRLTCQDMGGSTGGEGPREWAAHEFNADVVMEGVRSGFGLSPL